MRTSIAIIVALMFGLTSVLSAQSASAGLALKEVKRIMFNKQDSKKLTQMGVVNDAIYATVGGQGGVQYFQAIVDRSGIVSVTLVSNPDANQKATAKAAATAVTSADQKQYGFAFTAKNGKQLFVAVKRIVPFGKGEGTYTAEIDFQGGNTVRKKLGHINKAPKK